MGGAATVAWDTSLRSTSTSVCSKPTNKPTKFTSKEKERKKEKLSTNGMTLTWKSKAFPLLPHCRQEDIQQGRGRGQGRRPCFWLLVSPHWSIFFQSLFISLAKTWESKGRRGQRAKCKGKEGLAVHARPTGWAVFFLFYLFLSFSCLFLLHSKTAWCSMPPPMTGWPIVVCILPVCLTFILIIALSGQEAQKEVVNL